ncbi:hypothetical protein EDB89DRAFT_2232715 [Lactarius sanguifluus]|nr:hypothetical protein EDB89DRAFT_2232715 [Lactarius sanguifluus]
MSSIPLHVSPASSSGDVLSIRLQNLLDSLDADTILQSRGSCEIRVPGFYIARFSPVLGALIRDASNSIIPGNADAPLLVVRLPESGMTFSSLLGFISPFPYSPSIGHGSDNGAPLSSSEVQNELRADPYVTDRGIGEKAGSALTILGGCSQSRSRAGSPTIPLSLPECVDVSQADIIVRIQGYVFSRPAIQNRGVDEIPIVQLSEDAELNSCPTRPRPEI